LFKYFIHEAPIFFKNCDKRTLHLGIEKAFEELEEDAESKKPTIKVMAKDENNFTILFDEKCNGIFTDLFVFKDGFEVVLDDDDDEDEED
jgi:hypothetical protein